MDGVYYIVKGGYGLSSLDEMSWDTIRRLEMLDLGIDTQHTEHLNKYSTVTVLRNTYFFVFKYTCIRFTKNKQTNIHPFKATYLHTFRYACSKTPI